MNVSLLEVSIRTGRTHQIRVHLAHLGWPILGDSVYAPKAIAALAPRQMLHAFKLGMEHPVTRRHMLFTAPPPPDFSSTLLANYRPFTRLVITGNQGCGKSSFCKALASLGLPVISADAVVAELYGKTGEAASWIGEHFGEDLLHKDGSVNKAALFEFIEQKPHMRKELENVVHGLVKDRIEGFWQKMQAASQNMAVAEIPLFFESGLQNQMQNCYTVGISCEKAQRWQRIAQSRHWSEEKIEAIEKWQWPEDRKMNACQQVVSNSGNYDQLAKAASDLIVHINARQNARASELAQLLPQICGVEYSVHLG